MSSVWQILTKIYKRLNTSFFSSKFSLSTKLKAILAIIIVIIWKIFVSSYCTLLSITVLSNIVQFISNTFNTKFSIHNKQHYLITLPYSHYCEKARWVLDKANINYIEEGWAPIWALIAYFYSSNISKSVPKLIIPTFHMPLIGGRICMDSNEISMYSHLYSKHCHSNIKLFGKNETELKEIVALETYLDEHFGHKAFMIAYYYLYGDEHGTKLLIDAQSNGLKWSLLQNATKWIWGDAARFFLWNLAFNFENEKSVKASFKAVDDTFDKIGDMLSDGRNYLIKDCDNISVADIAFVSLALPVLLPDEWSRKWFIAFDSLLLPHEYTQFVIAKRNTVAGKFALKIWKEHRHLVQI